MARQVETVELPQQVDPIPDPLARQIAQSVAGVQQLRDDLANANQKIRQQGGQILTLESENATLRIQLESERGERAYYHRFAVGVGNALNQIGRLTDDVMALASQEAARKDQPQAQLPDLQIPKWLTAKRKHDQAEETKQAAE